MASKRKRDYTLTPRNPFGRALAERTGSAEGVHKGRQRGVAKGTRKQQREAAIADDRHAG